MRNALVSRISKYTVAWLAAAAVPEAGAVHTASASGWEAALTVLSTTAGITDSIPNPWPVSYPISHMNSEAIIRASTDT